MNRDYFELEIPKNEYNMNNYTDLRMQMYRNRKGFGLESKGNHDIRNFAVGQFRQYMEQIDKIVYPNGHKKGEGILMEESYARSGIRGPEDLIYIDGMPAIDFVTKLGYNPQHLRDYPEILQAEIAAAMTGGRSHVDIMLPTENENGERVMKAHELRADVKDLDAKKGWMSSTRNQKMESLYQSKKRESRMNNISTAWERKQNIGLLAEQILYNEGISGADLQDGKKFKQEKKQALKNAEIAVKHMEKGDMTEWKQINSDYFRKAKDYYSDAVTKADQIAMSKLGYQNREAYQFAWSRVGEHANIPAMFRPDTRCTNAVMFAMYCNPNLQWKDVVSNPERFGQAIADYYKFTEANSLNELNCSEEEIAESLNAQAKFYQFARERMKEMKFSHDMTKREERIRHMEEEIGLNAFCINTSQSETNLKNRPEYIEAYGGKEAYENSAKGAALIQSLNISAVDSENPEKDAAARAAYQYGIKQYAPVLRNMDSSHVDEVVKTWNPMGLAKEMAALRVHFGAMEDEKPLEKYLVNGPLPGNPKEVKDTLAMATEEDGGVRTCREILDEIEKTNRERKQKNVSQVRRSASMKELVNENAVNEPARARRKGVYKKQSPNKVNQKEINPLEK